MGPLTFRPPAIKPSPELRWLLLRAFGPARSRFAGSVDGSIALELARKFGLRERIAARTQTRLLEEELGQDVARELSSALRRSAVEAMRLSSLARSVAETALRARIPAVFLKFAALDALKRIVPGSRPAADVDLLIPSARVEELQAALVSSGLVAGNYEPCEQHLAALRSPAGGSVELHHRLSGVRIEGGGSVTAEQLIECGLVENLPGYPEGCFVPSPSIHAAYLIVHGFVQHGPLPKTYPLFRVISDLHDLAGEGAREPFSRESVHSVIRREIRRRDLEAIVRLAQRLKQGDASLVEELDCAEAAPEVVLLRHIVARSVSHSYQRKLIIRSLLPVSDSPVPIAFFRTLAPRIFLSRKGIEDRYGASLSRLGYLARYLSRPFTLLFRLLSYSGWLRRGHSRAVDLGTEIGQNTPQLQGKGAFHEGRKSG